MFKTSFIITEKNNQDLNKIVEIAKNKTNTSISKTSLINTAIAYFIENATNTNTGLSIY